MTTPLIRLLNDASTSAQLPHETLRTLCGEAAAEIARLHTLIPAKQLPTPTPVVLTYTPQAIHAMLDAANPYQARGRG